MFLRSLSICLGLIATPTSLAIAQTRPSNDIIETMRTRSDPGTPLRFMKRTGMLTLRPQVRADYEDYYIPQRPLRIFESRVVLITESYLINWIGCCADPGIGLYFEVNPAQEINPAGHFAQRNSCFFDNNPERNNLPPEVRRAMVPGKAYVYVKCGERSRP